LTANPESPIANPELDFARVRADKRWRGDAMNVLRAAIGILGLALLGLVIWAAVSMQDLHGTFMDQLAVLTTLPWGIAALADLYVGFVLFATLVFLTERSWVIAALWAAPVFILGNIWAALWFVIRLPHLAKQLSKPDWPAS
jgi:hypothetical protein